MGRFERFTANPSDTELTGLLSELDDSQCADHLQPYGVGFSTASAVVCMLNVGMNSSPGTADLSMH